MTHRTTARRARLAVVATLGAQRRADRLRLRQRHATTASPAARTGGGTDSVVLAEQPWVDLQVENEIAVQILDELGYDASIKKNLSVENAASALGTGDIDAYLGNWWPSQEPTFGELIDGGDVDVRLHHRHRHRVRPGRPGRRRRRARRRRRSPTSTSTPTSSAARSTASRPARPATRPSRTPSTPTPTASATGSWSPAARPRCSPRSRSPRRPATPSSSSPGARTG